MTNVTTEDTVERQEKWEAIDGIVTPAASALIAEDHEKLTITLLFSEVVDGCDLDLRLEFDCVLGYSVYEEFVHPWETLKSAPTLQGRWETYTYPLLEIKNSRWMASLPNFLLVHPDSLHYRFLTLDEIVDVLCSTPPEVSWVSGRQRKSEPQRDAMPR